MKLCIDRLLPPIELDDTICFELPEGQLESPENMLKITESITQAVASGQLSIQEAEKFTTFVNRQVRAIDNAETKKKWG